ncbi:MAG TPA: hypothetical protein VH479_08905 [Acidimicrobiales bacterium]
MIWLTWRQFRTPALAAAAALVATLAVMAVTGSRLAHDYTALGLSSCAAGQEPRAGTLSCVDLEAKFLGYYPLLRLIGPLLLAVPALIGAFWGAPLLARELEAGTHRLAWVQSVTRTRWLGVKVVVIGVVGAGLTALLGVAVTLWSGPFDRLNGRMTPEYFAQRGVVPLAYAAFAFALGVAAGAVIRRVLPAMAATLAGFVLVRIGVQYWVRPRLVHPLELSWPTYTSGDHKPPARVASQHGWELSFRTLDRTGHVISTGGGMRDDVVVRLCHQEMGTMAKVDLEECGRQLGFHNVLRVVPADRFWALQAWEAAIFGGLALALVGFSFWWVRRRAG